MQNTFNADDQAEDIAQRLDALASSVGIPPTQVACQGAAPTLAHSIACAFIITTGTCTVTHHFTRAACAFEPPRTNACLSSFDLSHPFCSGRITAPVHARVQQRSDVELVRVTQRSAVPAALARR